MLQVHENEIQLRKCPGGAAHLRICAPQRGNWLADINEREFSQAWPSR